LFEKGIDFGSSFFWGNVMGLGASFSWALYTLLGKKYAAKYGAFYTTSLSMYIGFLVYLPVYALFPISTAITDITLPQWGQLAFLGVITSGLGYALWNYALSIADASKVSVFNNLQPVLTTILAFFFLGTEPGLLFIIGGIVAIAGVIMTQRG
jgi:drug/metabolite transporter (DMT)-like permease